MAGINTPEQKPVEMEDETQEQILAALNIIKETLSDLKWGLFFVNVGLILIAFAIIT